MTYSMCCQAAQQAPPVTDLCVAGDGLTVDLLARREERPALTHRAGLEDRVRVSQKPKCRAVPAGYRRSTPPVCRRSPAPGRAVPGEGPARRRPRPYCSIEPSVHHHDVEIRIASGDQ